MFYSKSTGGFYSTEINGRAIPADAIEIGAEEHSALLSGQSEGMQIVGDMDGKPILLDPPPLTAQQVVARFSSSIQQRLDEFARTRNYDDILSACTYATSNVAKFKAEGQYAVQARDLTWSVGYGILAGVEDGSRPIPTEAEVMAELPPLAWPV